ncbi:MAG: hypothetical protein OK455_05680 [Thaumarchaeota archaeon]|jgi:hypothetical protein|nr:hypothetical protein [Nitrososphaerota archaeon]
MLKAKSSRRNEFWFTDAQVLVVNVLSAKSDMLLLTAVWIPTFAIFEVVQFQGGQFGLLATGVAVLIWALISIALSSWRRRRLSKLSTEAICAMTSTERLAWSQIKAADIRGKRISFWTDVKKYQGKVSRTDLQSLKELLSARLGQRLTINP